MNKTIKAIVTSKYEISLIETPSHGYVVEYNRSASEYFHSSYFKMDLKSALCAFDGYLEELQSGH